MSNKIKKMYLVHHSHTDIGYTDLQERVLQFQLTHIRSCLELFEKEENSDFRWNCETYFCVERFLEKASPQEKNNFFELIRQNKIGISANYLNFTDLADYDVLMQRIGEMIQGFSSQGITVKTAMIADINGISMGQRDVLLDNGIEFLYTNIHTHHGMYPLYQNQNAYFWESKSGKRLLVFNGEHYNLGNALGLRANKTVSLIQRGYYDNEQNKKELVNFHNNLQRYLDECESEGYPYDFIISSVSGVFSDNAPPNTDILRMIEAYHREYGDSFKIQMVTLSELYELIKNSLGEIPVYKGDLTDWWANGVGSTPYAVKHYRAAQRLYRLAGRIDPDVYTKFPEETKVFQDNLLIYAEHTWGHSASITDPFETMVFDLDLRKQSYASKAHEAAALLQNYALSSKNPYEYYYNTTGKIRALNCSNSAGLMLVDFYIETPRLPGLILKNVENNQEMTLQLSPHPRGVRISFTDHFQAGETKEYIYEEIPAEIQKFNSRHAFVGSERVRDIVNDYDTSTYPLPYQIENPWFLITYEVNKGFTSFVNRKTGQNMLKEGLPSFFTPVYERTDLRKGVYSERSALGRNIRGVHAQQFKGYLKDVICRENGSIFTIMDFIFELEGTRACTVSLKLFKDMPRIDFSLRLAKELSDAVESIYMPLQLNLPSRSTYFKKGTEAFLPGVEQIVGTNMEYWMSDLGAVIQSDDQSVLIHTFDTPLFYMGELKHHPIMLCDNNMENNSRDLYSWIMNNTWETNFKLDLSGYGEFCYRIELLDKTETEACFDAMQNNALGVVTYNVLD